ncbi:uncharacterized protein LOC106152224 [Lingula anatina]|uniref:Uncharacterized protein LOC106152224 n=1 Tax=Lingula anatina TaxID=7574 RepID=A0A1S3H5B0_LINAN|nr:uncharacterized protein LOC106152224 [Lingula anatina]|eukprot:XP_013381193.1 uncharacterized protein LOC106152224 [Lingula anatina]
MAGIGRTEVAILLVSLLCLLQCGGAQDTQPGQQEAEKQSEPVFSCITCHSLKERECEDTFNVNISDPEKYIKFVKPCKGHNMCMKIVGEDMQDRSQRKVVIRGCPRVGPETPGFSRTREECINYEYKHEDRRITDSVIGKKEEVQEYDLKGTTCYCKGDKCNSGHHVTGHVIHYVIGVIVAVSVFLA